MEINNKEIDEESFFEVLENPKEILKEYKVINTREKILKKDLIKKFKKDYEKEIDVGIKIFKKKILESYEKNLEEIIQIKNLEKVKDTNFDHIDKEFQGILEQKLKDQKMDIKNLKEKIKKNIDFSKNVEILSKSNEIKILNLKTKLDDVEQKEIKNEDFLGNLAKIEGYVNDKFKDQHQREENCNRIGIKHEKQISNLNSKIKNLKTFVKENISNNNDFELSEKITNLKKKVVFCEKNQTLFLQEIQNLKKTNTFLIKQNEKLFKQLENLLEKKPKKNLLHRNVKKNNLEKVKKIIKQTKNINELDKNNHTSLYYAIKAENKEIIKMLKKNGAKLQREEITKNFLKSIIDFEDTDSLKILIAKKEHQNLYPENKNSLLYAFQQNKPKSLKMLFTEKEDLLIFGNSLFNLIKENFEKENCLKIIFSAKWDRGMDLNILNNLGDSLIHQAAFFGLNELIDLFIFFKLDLNLKNYKNESPILVAAKNLKEKTVLFLLEKNCDFQILDNDENSVLHFIAKFGFLESLEFLVKINIDLNLKNFKGETALHLGIMEKNDEIVKILLKNEASLVLKNNKDESCYDLFKKFYGNDFSDIFGNIETKLKYD